MRVVIGCVICVAVALTSAAVRLEAQTTTRVSVATDGTQGSTDGTSRIALSGDGRFVAFSSAAPTLVPGDTNAVSDVFVHDRVTGTTTRVSVATGGLQADGPSSVPALSTDGRIVAFQSAASNLVPADTNGVSDLFVHDRVTGETSRISVDGGGAQFTGPSTGAAISADGRVVAFDTKPAESYPRACIRDRRAGATTCLLSPTQANPVHGFTWVPLWSEAPSVSADGRVVLVTEIWNSYGFPVVRAVGILHDLDTGATRTSNTTGLLAGEARHIVSSGGGRVTVTEIQTGSTDRVDVGLDGGDSNGESGAPAISADGRMVAFVSQASNLVPGDTNMMADAFVRDLAVGTTYRVSVASNGAQATLPTGSVALSADGQRLGFASAAPNLVTGDTNGADDVFVHDLDADEDTLPAPWETAFGLDPRSPVGIDGPAGDPDVDGVTNAQEYADRTHPRAQHARYLAEGTSSGFFAGTRFALLNLAGTNRVLLRFTGRSGTLATRLLTFDGLARRTLVAADIAGIADAQFSTVIESESPVVVDRLMTWDVRGYGAHAETAMTAPSTTWYLAEGATHHNFSLFYLVQNPNATSVPVMVTYLLPAPAFPLTKIYTVPAQSRFNIWVNDEALRDPALAGLAGTDVSARLVATQPVLVERAMYLDQAGPDGTFGTSDDVLFNAGHESTGVTAPALSWFLAEGATGPYFDEFILIANPGDTAAQVEARYLLADGTVLTKAYTVAPLSRFNIWVNEEEFPGQGKALEEAALSAIVTSVNGVPIIVERAMWWPRPSPFWMEAHNSAGVTATGTIWGLAEGESGGTTATETYILIANTSSFPGTARVTLVIEGGGTATVDVALAPNSRTNVPAIEDWFPGITGNRFGALIESLGGTPAQIVVERAMYSDANGVHWAAGTNATATRLEP